MALSERIGVIALILLLVTPGAVATSTSSWIPDGTEPAFLQNIGPQDKRSDNPHAATIVALGVAFILYIGFRSATPASR